MGKAAAVSELLMEHEEIRDLLRILLEMAAQIEIEKPLPAGDLGTVLDYLTSFIEDFHQAKEEHFLFPAVEIIATQSCRELLAELRREHAAGHSLAAGLLVRGPDTPPAKAGGGNAEFINACRALVVLQARHLDKEERLLFPAAEAELVQAGDGALVQAFSRVKHATLAAGWREECRRRLKRLARAYLPRHLGCPAGCAVGCRG